MIKSLFVHFLRDQNLAQKSEKLPKHGVFSCPWRGPKHRFLHLPKNSKTRIRAEKQSTTKPQDLHHSSLYTLKKGGLQDEHFTR